MEHALRLKTRKTKMDLRLIPSGLQGLRRPDLVNAVRHRFASMVDGVWALTVKRLQHLPPAASVVEDDPRVALIAVNFSTTRYLKLLLATLAEQSALGLLTRIVIVDNCSRDGGVGFLRELAARVDRIDLVERRHFLSHAHGMRAGVAALRRADRDLLPGERANHLLFSDTDVIWRNPDALLHFAAAAFAYDAALAGEMRHVNVQPDIQASFFLTRLDVYDDRRTAPLINDGAPAYRLQRSIFDRGLPVVDFPSNHGGYTLHRGRSGVAAAAKHYPGHPYARFQNTGAHFMGVPDGAAIWAAVEGAHAEMLTAEAEPRLLDHLADRFAALGTPFVLPSE